MHRPLRRLVPRALPSLLAVACIVVLPAPGRPEEPVPEPSPNASAPFRETLIDAATGLRIPEWSVDGTRVDLGSGHAWRVRKTVLHGGRQEGVDMVEVDNGVLSFRVAATRGMSLIDGRCGEVRLGWDSPVEEVVHPKHVNLESRGGLGWLEGFSQWVNRCGLASNGAPGVDEVRSNTGAIVPVELTLHGKVDYIPARRVEVRIERGPPARIVLRGVVDETMMFGPRLRLETEISTELGSKSVVIHDEVRNLAATPQETQLIYHCNFGPPLLGEGARLVAPVERVWPRDARAAEGGLANWNRYGAPDPAFTEQVYYLRLLAGDDSRTEVLLRGPRAQRGASLAFSVDELPCLTVWKNTAAPQNGYVTGLEPGTNYPNHRSHEREAGRVPVLKGGERRASTLRITALTGPDEVRAAEARVERLRGGRAPQVETEPELE